MVVETWDSKEEGKFVLAVVETCNSGLVEVTCNSKSVEEIAWVVEAICNSKPVEYIA